MSIIFQKLSKCSEHFIEVLNENGTPVDEGHSFSWPNYVYTSTAFRRAHLDIVDARDTKNLYMMHLCIFPHTNDKSPIYGFDLIAGPNKVTGAFHDFSSSFYPDQYMMKWFANRVNGLEWSKKRDLPDWAKSIFSDSMIAAGNIREVSELDTILDTAKSTLEYYMKNVGKTRVDDDVSFVQDFYCYNQRRNPHTPKVMESLGLDHDTVQHFIQSCLFPCVPTSQKLNIHLEME